MATNEKRTKLVCEKCLSRNYVTNKSLAVSEKLELKKFCSKCNAHTIHKETR